jgi:hypothetical protein
MNAAVNVTMPRTNIGVARNLNSGPRAASFGMNTAPSASAPGTNTSALVSATGFLKGWGGIALVILILVVLFAVYYETIGYYIQIGWKKLQWSHERGETVEVKVPGGPSAILRPIPEPSQAKGESISAALAGAVSTLETDVEAALGAGAGGKQVFNVARNVYTFHEAEPLCRAFGAELATYDQVKDAYKAGADWCNYGWVKGQLAVYPTQKSTYDKLQHGPEEERMSCGLPGVNGGYFPNAEQRFGVNCYGARPAESALDERIQMEEKSHTAFDREVNHFKAELDSIGVNPWSSKQWSA